MANQLYKNFPEIQYKLSNGKIVTVKDFFRKAKLEGNQLEQLIDYTFYEIQEGERPDVIASKLYGDGDLHWTIFLANEITNYYDWYMDTPTFEAYMKDKYKGQVLVADNTTDIVDSTSKFLIGEDITSAFGSVGKILKVDPTFKRLWVQETNGVKFNRNYAVTGASSGKVFTPTSVVNPQDAVAYYYNGDAYDKGIRYNHPNDALNTNPQPRSFYEKEFDDNDAKRRVKVIRPQFIRRVVSEFERIMS